MSDAELIALEPIEASQSGKNAYYHFCHIRGGQQSYAVCLHILKAIDEQRISKGQFEDCQRACTRDDCDARRMRAEEIKAGHALYYKQRLVFEPVTDRPEVDQSNRSSGKYDLTNPSYARGWASVGRALGKESTGKNIQHKPAFKNPPKPSAPPKPKDHFVQEGLADLVNVLASEKPKPAAPAPSPKSDNSTNSLKPMPGETPLEFARRRAAANKGAK